MQNQNSLIQININRTLLGAMALIFSHWGHADMALPSPGLTLRTNGSDCLNQYRSSVDLMRTYFSGFPATSSLRRLDVLIGGVVSTSAFTPLASGTYSTEYYSMASTYSDTSGNFTGSQKIGLDYGKPSANVISNDMSIQLGNSVTAGTSLRFSSCDANSQAKDGVFLSFQKGSWSSASSSDMVCYLNLNLAKSTSGTALCDNPSQNLKALVANRASTQFQGKLKASKDGAWVDVPEEVHSDFENNTAYTNAQYDWGNGNYSYSNGGVWGYCWSMGSYVEYPYQQLNDSTVIEAEKQRLLRKYALEQYEAQKNSFNNEKSFYTTISSAVTEQSLEGICNLIPGSSGQGSILTGSGGN